MEQMNQFVLAKILYLFLALICPIYKYYVSGDQMIFHGHLVCRFQMDIYDKISHSNLTMWTLEHVWIVSEVFWLVWDYNSSLKNTLLSFECIKSRNYFELIKEFSLYRNKQILIDVSSSAFKNGSETLNLTETELKVKSLLELNWASIQKILGSSHKKRLLSACDSNQSVTLRII